MNPLPRYDELIVEHLDSSVLIYDVRAHAAHALEGESALVWRALAADRDVPQVAAVCGLSESLVTEIVARLAALDLLVDSRPQTLSRRAALTRTAKLGAGATLATTLISTVVVPAALAQNSTCTNVGSVCTLTYLDSTCSTTPIPSGCAGVCTCTPDPQSACAATGLGIYTRSGTCS